ncbi:MAG: polysaccharide ABC transporter ATP-binding protein [Nitrospira sp.]|nr:polysaccharide ABC transporter ATP-binding protein [Nitrospira sp.]
MGDIAIRAQGLSKQYAIGVAQAQKGSFYERIASLWQKNHPTIWALREVSFEVKQGEVLGIIGRNGSGKSTLLKILSRITKPTKGQAEVQGRVGSLLEVGTGFHPELTGRENIRLNGAMLGMGKAEVDRHFDAIVAFAEIEQFIDTPVKRYSSGMYMRLAFAVAAHLQREILLVDEVLAVGDAQFQKKCLAQLEQQQVNGRTVLFVSHNMGAVRNLCTRVLVLKSGEVSYDGATEAGISQYLETVSQSTVLSRNDFIGTLADTVRMASLDINGRRGAGSISPRDKVTFVLTGECVARVDKFRFSISLFKDGFRVFTVHDTKVPAPLEKRPFTVTICLPPYVLRPGQYTIGIGGHDGGVYAIGIDWLYASEVASLEVKTEWGEMNDIGGLGTVNVPHTGSRE